MNLPRFLPGLSFLALCLLLVGCTGITQLDAERSADQFIKEKVKFFSTLENSTTNVSGYVTSMDSYRDGDLWVVIAHVSSTTSNGTVKTTDLIVKMDTKGRVLEFNNQDVPDAPR